MAHQFSYNKCMTKAEREKYEKEKQYKHPDIFQLVSARVGLKENAEYKDLYNPRDPWGESLAPLAKRNFKRFVATVYHILVNEGKSYDLIIGAGDSGIAMAKLTEMIYKQANIPAPKSINLPIVRFAHTKVIHPDQPLKLFDNSILIPKAAKDLQDIKRVENILFVDDEIKNGITAGESVKVALSAIAPEKIDPNPHVTIVAEDQGFEPEKFLDGVTAEIYTFAEQVKDMFGVVGYIIPWNIERQIKEHFNEVELGNKNRINALLDLPGKETYEIDGMTLYKPVLSNAKTERAKNEIPNFAILQKEFRESVNKLISEAIAEYTQTTK